MRAPIIVLIFIAFLAISVLVTWGQVPGGEARGVLGVLRPGQPVILKESGGRYEVTITQHGLDSIGPKVVEVASEYIVVEDVRKIRETRIPLFSIQAVIVLKNN